MKKILAMVLCAAVLLPVSAVSAAADAPLTFTVESKAVAAGELFTLALYITNNGIDGERIAAITDLAVSFDPSRLEWAGERLETISQGMVGVPDLGMTVGDGSRFAPGYAAINFDSVKGTGDDGVLLNLHLKARDGFHGGALVEVDVYRVHSYGGNWMTTETVNGLVRVIDYLPGDVNADGKVNSVDVTHLRRHLADWEDYRNLPEPRAVVFLGTDEVSAFSITTLRRFVAGWSGVVLHPAPEA